VNYDTGAAGANLGWSCPRAERCRASCRTAEWTGKLLSGGPAREGSGGSGSTPRLTRSTPGVRDEGRPGQQRQVLILRGLDPAASLRENASTGTVSDPFRKRRRDRPVPREPTHGAPFCWSARATTLLQGTGRCRPGGILFVDCAVWSGKPPLGSSPMNQAGIVPPASRRECHLFADGSFQGWDRSAQSIPKADRPHPGAIAWYIPELPPPQGQLSAPNDRHTPLSIKHSYVSLRKKNVFKLDRLRKADGSTAAHRLRPRPREEVDHVQRRVGLCGDVQGK
jgi:hypothetical protein